MNKNRDGIIFIPVLIALLLLVIIGYFIFQKNFQNGNQNLIQNNYPAENEPTSTPLCRNSNDQCKGQKNGTSCTYGWCDKEGRECGGNSCSGLGIGACYDEECVVDNSSEPKDTIITQPSQNLEGLIQLLDNHTTWLVYKSNQCGFSIKYPDYFDVYEKNCEIAFYFGNGKSFFSFCPLIHLVINNNSCGSLAYKGTATLIETVNVKVGDELIKRSDYEINGIILESHFEPLGANYGEISISFYNGGKTPEQSEIIRSLFNQMVESVEPY